MQETGRGIDVAMAAHLDISGPEDVTEQPTRGRFGERPHPALAPLAAIDGRHPGDGREQQSAGPERLAQLAYCRRHVVNQVQRLGDDRAIESLFWQHPRLADVTNYRRARLVPQMEHVLALDPPTEPPRIKVFADFQHTAPNAVLVRAQELLDIITVDRGSPIEAECRADRLGSSKVAEVHGANARPAQGALDRTQQAKRPRSRRLLLLPVAARLVALRRHSLGIAFAYDERDAGRPKVIRRGEFFGQMFPSLALATRSPLAPQLRPYLPLLPLVIVLGLAASLAEGIGITLLIPIVALLLSDQLPAGLPHFFVALADVAERVAPAQRVFALGAAVIVLMIVKGMIQAADSAVIASIDGRLARDIRNALADRILALEYPFFLRNESARLVQIISTDSWYAAEAIRALLTIIPAAAGLVVFAGLLSWLEWRLTLIAIASAAIIAGGLIVLQRVQGKLGLEVAESNHALGERMLGILAAIRSIRIFEQRERESSRFARASEQVRRDLYRIQRISVSTVPLVEVLASLMFVAVLLAAYRLGTPVPAMVAYLVLLARALPYAQVVSRGRVEFAARSGSVRNVEWLLDQRPASAGLAGLSTIVRIDRPIRFEHVSFAYPDGTKALDQIDVVLRPGIATALIGKSGAGKSSFMDLLCRLVDPASGTILHGDQPLDGIDPRSWRSRIAVAGQNVGLVDGTIAENIAYGRPDASDDDIAEAAAAARASAFIEGLPNGFATRLGLDGFKLSGGERQRIELARALLRQPDILILDEALSAVDTSLEQEIIALLKKRERFFTALVISHRKATLAACEDGIVIDGGRVIEAGLLRELDYFRSMGAELEA